MVNLSVKLESMVRFGLVHFLSGLFPLYVVNEHPKSGGTWVAQMLGRALAVPFPRNRFPLFKSSMMHGHYLSPWGMKNVVVVWRDGRDVMVSWYHHCLFQNERGNTPLVDIVRKDLQFDDYENVRENLPQFIEYSFSRQRHPRFSWADFVRQWHGRSAVTYVRYEDLRQDTTRELQRIVLELTGIQLEYERAAEIAEEFSFSQQAGRQPGVENKRSFMRKGVVGDWHNHFGHEARKMFEELAGDELLLLGYERDSQWVNGNSEDTEAH